MNIVLTTFWKAVFYTAFLFVREKKFCGSCGSKQEKGILYTEKKQRTPLLRETKSNTLLNWDKLTTESSDASIQSFFLCVVLSYFFFFFEAHQLQAPAASLEKEMRKLSLKKRLSSRKSEKQLIQENHIKEPQIVTAQSVSCFYQLLSLFSSKAPALRGVAVDLKESLMEIQANKASLRSDWYVYRNVSV